jgi:hypothetical protein
VAWDESLSEFFVRDGVAPLDQFDRIVSAVAREYGDRLFLSPSTAYFEIPNELLAALRDASR